MSGQSHIDSLSSSPEAIARKSPVGAQPPKRRRTRPIDQAAAEHERELLWAFGRWLKYPTKPSALEEVSHLIVAHEIRAYLALAQITSPLPNKTK